MSSRTPFNRVGEAFDELARARPCDISSRSEHAAEYELSELINSFIDIEDSGGGGDCVVEEEEEKDYCSDSDSMFTTYVLRRLLEYEKEEDVKATIRSETEKLVSSSYQEEDKINFKRRLMGRLRERGLDVGICKSTWTKSTQFPAGDYEYVDVSVNQTRYIVEVNLAGEFTIARPTSDYEALLDVFPLVYVKEAENLKKVVKVMSAAVKMSMKSRDMHVPPWRRNGYMLSKWFGAYKRTTTNVVGEKTTNALRLRYCKVELGMRADLRVGNLSRVLLSTNCN